MSPKYYPELDARMGHWYRLPLVTQLADAIDFNTIYFSTFVSSAARL